MMLMFDQSDIRRELGSSTLDKGLDLWAEDRVLEVEVTADGARIGGSVLGSQRRPYRQSISIVPQKTGKPRIIGTCSCPMQRNCRHVAAVLLEYEMTCKIEAAPSTSSRPNVYAITAQASTAQASTARASTTLARISPPPAVPPSSTLSKPVAGWLDRMTSAIAVAPEPTPAEASKQRTLFYVLEIAAPGLGTGAAMPHIRAMTARPRKGGGLADIKAYDPVGITRAKEQWGRFVGERDVSILRDLVWLSREGMGATAAGRRLGNDAVSLRVLNECLASDRLRLGTVEGSVLRAGPEVRAEPAWIKCDGGLQQLTLRPCAHDVIEASSTATFDDILPLATPHYVDRTRGLIGPIKTTLPASLAAEVAQAPPITASEAAQVKELMRQRLAPNRALATPRRSSAVDSPNKGASGDATPPPVIVPLLPLPEAPDNVEVRTGTPIPRLDLLLLPAKLRHSYAWYSSDQRHRGQFPLPVAALSFDYDGEIVPVGSETTSLDRLDGDKLIVTMRDAAAETRAANRLHKLGMRGLDRAPFELTKDRGRERDLMFLAPPGNPDMYEVLETFDDPARFLAFSADVVPALAGEGWRIEYAEDYPYRIAEGTAEWWADTGEGSGIDWFSFELGIEYDGHRINLVPHLAQVLERLPPELSALALQAERVPEFIRACSGLRMYHPLPDGRLLPLPGERIAPILKALLELIGPRGDRLQNGKVKLHRAEAGALAAFAGEIGADVAWAASAERLIALGHDLRRGRGLIAIAPPATFQATLRPYQSEGLAWLDFLRGSGFGGVLADDMGLGKTVQALAFVSREKAEGRLDKPILIIAPTSVLPNWQNEAERFAPELSVLPLRGLERKQLFGLIPSHDIVLTTYPLLARDADVLLAQEFHAAILDEAQAIKNPKATVTGLAHRINARHRFALTGTPLENNLGEVWSLFEFLSPGLLGDESTFRRTFRTPIEKHGDQSAQAFLSRRLKPFMLRRTKEAVATELPPKTEIVERIRLEGPQRDLYETVRALMDKRVRDEISRKGLAKSHIVFLDALLKLRQICCDPRLLKMPQARRVKGSAKLERLMELIPELVGEGRRILLFSQFTSMLALIEDELKALAIPYVMLTGDTVDRATPVKQFQAGKVPLFLLSLKAGGTGLNLTAADTVIHYDPWWNPAVENQATDRAHRIGQDKPVFVHKLMVEEGIEEAIELLKRKKAALAEALFAGTSKTPLELTEADISALFAPLGPARTTGLKKAA